MPKLVRPEGFDFTTKAEATAAASAVLRRYPLKTAVTAEDDIRLLGALFDKHPDRESKMRGRRPVRFGVHPNIGGSRCFYVVFSDGTMIDFSYKKAIDAAADR